MRTPSTARRTYQIQLFCEILGALAVIAGCFMIWLPVGFLVTGAALILAGNARVGGTDADLS